MIQMELKACGVGSGFTVTSNVMLQILYQRMNMYGNIKNTMESIDTIHKAYSTATTSILHFPHPPITTLPPPIKIPSLPMWQSASL